MGLAELPDDWFETTARENFERAFLPSSNMPGLRYLQIGAFTGNASVWLLENVLTSPSSKLIDVDTWDGGGCAELDGIDWEEVEKLYQERTQKWQNTSQLIPYTTSSFNFLSSDIWGPYDFIYIDGAHDVVSVLEDAVMAYRVLKPGGFMAFDDYTWQSKHGAMHEPTMAIDLIKIMYAEKLQVRRVDSQCWMQRVDAEVRR